MRVSGQVQSRGKQCRTILGWPTGWESGGACSHKQDEKASKREKTYRHAHDDEKQQSPV